jgi:hypothetical protein
MNTKNLKKLVSLKFEYLFNGKTISIDNYVKNHTYLYSSNQSFFVKKDLVNTTNSNFYVSNDGKSLQFITRFGVNKDSDILSFFQEESVNNYQYNYKSNPVENVATSISENTSFGTVSERIPTALVAPTAATILESNTYDGTAYPLGSSPYFTYKFLVKNSYSN